MRPCQGRSRGFKSRLPLQKLFRPRLLARVFHIAFVQGCGTQVAKGKVCKTFIRRFDSDPHLQASLQTDMDEVPRGKRSGFRLRARTPAKRLKFDSEPHLQSLSALSRQLSACSFQKSSSRACRNGRQPERSGRLFFAAFCAAGGRGVEGPLYPERSSGYSGPSTAFVGRASSLRSGRQSLKSFGTTAVLFAASLFAKSRTHIAVR